MIAIVVSVLSYGWRLKPVVHKAEETCVGGTFQATAGFQDSDMFHKGIKMALRCSLSANSHLSEFKL